MGRCIVPKCTENGIHRIPKQKKIRDLWIKAIRLKNIILTDGMRICRKHFLESDYGKISIYTGLEHQNKHLKKDAVPSIFPWNTKPLSKKAKARKDRLETRNLKKKNIFEVPISYQCCEDIMPLVKDDSVSSDYNVSQEIVVKQERNKSAIPGSFMQHKISCSTQTSNMLRIFSTELLLADDETVHYFTGLGTVAKFSLVLDTLLPMANNIKYRWSRVLGLSVEDQFLMLLMKLKRNTTDFELSKIFGVSKTEVSNIIVSWIHFVSDIWSLTNFWPSQNLVNFYMPNSFKKHPSIRAIIDRTEKLDQDMANQKVHIERLIGLTKTYLILRNDLNHFYVPLASKIFSICLMLCHFRKEIIIVNKIT